LKDLPYDDRIERSGLWTLEERCNYHVLMTGRLLVAEPGEIPGEIVEITIPRT